ncbi:MAG: serine protease [Cyanobacteria bacterium J06627_32]
MSSFNTNSVVLVESWDEKRNEFGSGFVVHQDSLSTYIITCAHVVKDVGGLDNIKVSGKYKAQVIAQGSSFDIAILKVDTKLTSNPPLRVCTCQEPEGRFVIPGWFDYGFNSKIILPIYGSLIATGETEEDSFRVETHIFEVDTDSKHHLTDGYSGSPLIHERSGCVLGIVYQCKSGTTGPCLSVKAAKKICAQIPDLKSLSLLTSYREQLKDFLSQKLKIENEILSLEQKIRAVRMQLDGETRNE